MTETLVGVNPSSAGHDDGLAWGIHAARGPLIGANKHPQIDLESQRIQYRCNLGQILSGRHVSCDHRRHPPGRTGRRLQLARPQQERDI
jgi:hypothetical protein